MNQVDHFDNAAHANGFEAAYDMIPLSDNPFGDDTDSGKAWTAGWERAIREFEIMNGGAA